MTKINSRVAMNALRKETKRNVDQFFMKITKIGFIDFFLQKRCIAAIWIIKNWLSYIDLTLRIKLTNNHQKRLEWFNQHQTMLNCFVLDQK
jgi:hypothetical protein